MLLQQMMGELPHELIKEILSRNCVRSFLNHLVSSDSFLHRAAQKIQKAILDRSKVEAAATTSILEKLIAPPNGDINFDRKTKTKTVGTLLSNAAMSGTFSVLQFLESLILLPAVDDGKSAISARQMVVDQLVNAVRSVPHKPVIDRPALVFIQEALSLISKFAYFDLGPQSSTKIDMPMPTIDAASRTTYRARISSMLSYFIGQPLDASQIAYKLVCGLKPNRLQPGAWQLLLQLDPHTQNLLDHAFETLHSLQAGKDQETSPKERKSRSLLVALSILQVHNGDPDAIGILEELTSIARQESPNPDHRKTGDDTRAIVEILLALVSKPSLLFRRVSQDVFSSLTKDITEQGLEPMIKVRTMYC